jgi:hypothetical protein
MGKESRVALPLSAGWVTVYVMVISAAIGATWHVARTHLQDEMDQYHRSKDWNLPKLLADLGQTSEKLNATMAKREELENLKAEKQQLSQKLADMEAALIARDASVAEATQKANEALAKVEKLELQLAEVRGNPVTVKVGSSGRMGHNDMVVGVTRTSTFLNDADIVFLNTPQKVKVGTVLKKQIGNTVYLVELSQVGYDFCVFQCRSETPQHTREGEQ